MKFQFGPFMSLVGIVSIAIGLSGCGSPAVHSKTPAQSSSLFRVGLFTIRQVHLPAMSQYQTVLPGLTLTIGPTAPYVISRTLWGKKTPTVLDRLDCLQRPRWQPVSGPDAVLLCPGSPATAVVVPPSGAVSTYSLPVRLPPKLPPVKPPDTYGELGGMVAGGYLLWSVSGHIEYADNGPYAPAIAAGVLDLATGQQLPAPKDNPWLLSTDDQAYAETAETDGYHLLEWSHGAYEDRGTLSDPRIYAVDADGVVWSDQPDTANLYVDDLVMEHPGSRATHAWTLHGQEYSVGPGYMAYASAVESPNGETALLFFPIQHRTLRFEGLHDANGCCNVFSIRPLGLDQLLSLYYGPKVKNYLISP